MDINAYLKSGVLEAYISGTATAAETEELLLLKSKHPQIDYALYRLEIDLENLAQYMSIAPPPVVWVKIDAELRELIKTTESPVPLKIHSKRIGEEPAGPFRGGQFIEVQGASSHMRIHKIWRWVLFVIFILGKIFLGFAIYFYFESREAKKELEKLQKAIEKQQGR
ncbi:hypothetical protein [Pedobacter africanus]|uniref:Uncharacterized protein n=1 Tax=Pedobacter africanus TaxID=151894 RepID=A0A1W2C2Y4_9SPHI|nr:hypothetical protein [Pedobacter africanus]SMC79466.1 hypothetical protein SAMN04488524_2850 [Pedobacter africanus]